MTVGQRIAQKRKELGLSQENLGEQLGVSRQAIYKWESDATLPDVENLVALSRICSVSVGWLLGEEREPAQTGELTAEQLAMVQEIVDRYLEAREELEQEGRPSWQIWPEAEDEEPTREQLLFIQRIAQQVRETAPEQPKPRRRRWPYVVGAGAALALLLVFANLFGQLERLSSRYQTLQNSIGNISSDVSRQMSSMAGRIENILEEQNKLVAEWDSEIAAMDCAAGTVSFRVRVVPRTYREGMTALLMARTEQGTVEVPVELDSTNAFAGTVTCPLTDQIDLTAVFLTQGQRETQVLKTWSGLYTGSFPIVRFNGNLWFSTMDEKALLRPDSMLAETALHIEEKDSPWRAEVESMKVGLFRDRKLVMWYTVEDLSTVYNGKMQTMPHYVRGEEVTLERGSVYCEAVVVTDEYGRVQVYHDTPVAWNEEKATWSFTSVSYGNAPGEWEF